MASFKGEDIVTPMKDLSGIRVFVSDGFWRKSLAAVRGLGRSGAMVTVGESTYLAPALFSRYCHKRVRTPSPLIDPSGYVDFLDDYLCTRPHDVLIPMEEETLLLIAQNRTRFETKVRLPFADYDTLITVRDKLNVINRAASLGIPIPKTFEVPSLEEGMQLSQDLPYPVVVKPRVGAGSGGITYVSEPSGLLPALKGLFASGRKPFIQEKLPSNGKGIGASFLMDEDHSVRASFIHRRLREYPVEGGPSTLRESYAHSQASEDGLRLLQSFGFVGVAMVEFKMDPRDGLAKLLEVNPRFWGSLALSIDSGVNFPFLLTLMALGHNFAPVSKYRMGHLCRWLLPGDILHFIYNPDRRHIEPGFFRFRRPNQTYDIIDSVDPLPIAGAVLSLLPFYFSKDFKHVRTRRNQ